MSGAPEPGYRVVPLEDVPLDEVLALLRLCLGEGSLGRGASAFRWKHHESPFGRSAGLAAVAPDGTLAGVRLFQRWRLAAGGRELAAVRAVDTATHPAWRRRGVFRRLSLDLAEQLRAEGAALVFNTPNPRSRAGYLAMGWRSLGRVPLSIRPLRPGRIAAGLLRRRGPELHPEPPRPPAGTRPVAELLADPAAVALLGAPWSGEPRLHTPRTPDYLRWRYGSPPGPAEAPGAPVYGALWRFDRDAGAAVIARTRGRRGLTGVLLCEVLIGGGERGERAAAELIDIIAASSGADYLAAVAARGTPERRALAAAGFPRVGLPGPRLTVRGLAAPAPASLAEWRFSAGDLELF
jgi:GNAT superfamily N-acetyltransferase